MSNQTHDRPDDEHTLPSRKFAYSESLDKLAEERPVEAPRMTETGARALTAGAPWLLRQHFSNQIDLTKELNSRYPALQLLSVSRFRNLDTRHGVATLATADGVASLTIDADGASGMMDFAFSFASIHTLRFRLDHLTAVDRTSWLDRMHRDKDDVAFLWGESRWNQDYVI
ncbi:MAG TPA: hypothetical protein VHO69_08565, partial [Phototrophicaceae bacterium]|nr:hypothetical protein [Phototrophicaceae bacterium]